MYSSRNVLRQADSLNESFQSLSCCIRAVCLENGGFATSRPELIPRFGRTVYSSRRGTHSSAILCNHGCERFEAFPHATLRSSTRPLSRTTHSLRSRPAVIPQRSRSATSRFHVKDGLSLHTNNESRQHEYEFKKLNENRGKTQRSWKGQRTKADILDTGSTTTAGKVQLLFDMNGLSRAKDYKGMSSNPSNDFISLDISEARRPGRIKLVEKVLPREAEATYKFWEHHGLFEPDDSKENRWNWDETFRLLKRHIPPMRDQHKQFTITGTSELLLVAYHYLRAQKDRRVSPSFPLGPPDAAFMTFSCPAREVERLFSSKTSPLHHPELLVLPHSNGSGREPFVMVERPSRWGLDRVAGSVQNPFEPADSLNYIERKDWTIANFAQHIKKITEFRQPALLVGGVNRQKHFSDALEKLFEEAGFSKKVFSYGAMCDTILFMLRNARPRQAKNLFAKMRSRGYSPTMGIYNCFLEHAAREYRLDLFNSLLEEALSLGLLFDEGTWIAFAHAARSDAERHAVVEEALHCGFAVLPEFATQMTAITLPHSLGPFLDSGGAITEFISLTDDLYHGFHWLAGNALHGMLDVLGSRGLLVEAAQTINKLIQSRGIRLPKRSFHTLLAHSWLQQQNPDFAIWLVIYGELNWRVVSVENITLELLFNMAWKSCCYNLCRVIWVYAISMGRARHFMRWRVWDSLKKSREPLVIDAWRIAATKYKTFCYHAGSVICGQQLTSSADASLVARGIVQGQRELLSRLPLYRFADMLMEALLLDKKWSTSEYVDRRNDREWLIRNVIDVPLRVNQLFEDEDANSSPL